MVYFLLGDRGREITQKKEYDIQNSAKALNQE